MMRFITILFVLLYSLNGLSQSSYPIYQSFGSTSTLTEFKGAGKAGHAFINGVYTDTSSANLIGYFRFYPGAQIMAGDSFYLRDKTASRWLLINGSGGGGGGTWGSITGTLSNQTDLQAALNLKTTQSALDDTAAAIRGDFPGTIYTANGSLTGNRTLSGGGFNLAFNNANFSTNYGGNTIELNNAGNLILSSGGDVSISGNTISLQGLTTTDDIIQNANTSLAIGTNGSDPAGSQGMIHYNTTSNKFRAYENGSWVDMIGGSGSGTVNSGTQYRLGYYATTGTAISEAPAITGNRALISDANGVPTHSATTATELGYVSGVTSAIQTQLNGKVSGSLTANRIPYASATTTLTDNANFYRIVTPGLQGNTGVVSLGQVALGGSYNLVQNRNFDYLSNGNKSYQLEVIYNKAVYDSDSTSSGAFAVTSYSDDTGGNSIHSRKARGSQTSPTQVLAGDRLYSLGAKGYTNAGYFANSSFALIATADEAFTATANGTSATIEVTPAGTTSRVAALTLANSGAVSTLNTLAVGTTATINNNLSVGGFATIPTVYGSQASNGDLVLEGTGNATKTTSYVTLQPTGGNVGIGTTTPTGLFTIETAVGGTSPNIRFNDGDISLPSYSSVGFSPALDATTTFQIVPYSSTVGGVQLMGFSESGANTMIPISLSGYHGGTAPTTAAITMNAWKWNGSTNRTALGTNEIAFQVLSGANVLTTHLGGGNFGIGQATPTAVLHIKAGTATASTAPLKFTSGTNLTTPEAGAVEFDGTNYFVTSSTTRYTVAKTLTNTATLDFGSTAAGAKTDLTITVTGAADGDVVSVGAPNGSVPDNGSFSAWVSAANTVTVRYINNDLTNAKDPASGTFRVSVVKY